MEKSCAQCQYGFICYMFELQSYQERAIDVELDHVAPGCMFLPPRDHKWRKSGRRASLPPRPTLTVVDIDIDGKSVGKNSAAPSNSKTSSSSLTSNNRYR